MVASGPPCHKIGYFEVIARGDNPELRGDAAGLTPRSTPTVTAEVMDCRTRVRQVKRAESVQTRGEVDGMGGEEATLTPRSTSTLPATFRQLRTRHAVLFTFCRFLEW